MRATTKGQVTIPRNVREILGITPETEVEFIEENGRFYLVKTDSPKSGGKFRGKSNKMCVLNSKIRF